MLLATSHARTKRPRNSGCSLSARRSTTHTVFWRFGPCDLYTRMSIAVVRAPARLDRRCRSSEVYGRSIQRATRQWPCQSVLHSRVSTFPPPSPRLFIASCVLTVCAISSHAWNSRTNGVSESCDLICLAEPKRFSGGVGRTRPAPRTASSTSIQVNVGMREYRAQSALL